jgi:hypothetical protein
VDEIAQQAHEHMKKAQEYLKEVRDSLRDVLNEIKKSNRGSLNVIPPPSNQTNSTED